MASISCSCTNLPVFFSVTMRGLQLYIHRPSSTNTGIQTTHSLARGKDPLDPIQILADRKNKHWSKTFKMKHCWSRFIKQSSEVGRGSRWGGSGFSDSSLGIWIFGIRSIGFRGIKSPSMLKFKSKNLTTRFFLATLGGGVKWPFSSVNLTSIGVIKRVLGSWKKRNSIFWTQNWRWVEGVFALSNWVIFGFALVFWVHLRLAPFPIVAPFPSKILVVTMTG